MPDDILPEIPVTPAPSKLADARARIVELEAQLAPYLRADELAKAREDELAKARSTGAPRRLLGQIPVYDQDEPSDVIDRARALMRGQIPVDKARRFKTEAMVMIPKASPLAVRLGTHSPPVGTEFSRDELSDRDRTDLANEGAIVAIG